MANNIPICYKDVDLAEKIFKSDIPTTKGKITQSHPSIGIDDDIIEMPEKIWHAGQHINLEIYILYINDKAFLHSSAKTAKLKLISTLGKRKHAKGYDKEYLYKVLYEILRH